MITSSKAVSLNCIQANMTVYWAKLITNHSLTLHSFSHLFIHLFNKYILSNSGTAFCITDTNVYKVDKILLLHRSDILAGEEQ